MVLKYLISYLQFLMGGKAGHHASVFSKYQDKAEFFMCSCLGKGSRNVQKTPGGLIFKQRWNNLQFVTSASFLMTVYSDYLTSARKTLRCPSGNVQPSQLLSFAKSQVTSNARLITQFSSLATCNFSRVLKIFVYF